MNTNHRALPAATPRSVLPRALRRRIDPDQLKQLICEEKSSLSHAAHVIGVCINTVSIAAVRLGIPIDARPNKIDHAVNQRLLHALERNLPLGEIATETGVSLSSIYRFLRIHPAQASAYKSRMLEQERLAKRQRFAVEAASMAMNACSDYYWLRRNDAAWFAQFARPPHFKSTPTFTRRSL